MKIHYRVKFYNANGCWIYNRDFDTAMIASVFAKRVLDENVVTNGRKPDSFTLMEYVTRNNNECNVW